MHEHEVCSKHGKSKSCLNVAEQSEREVLKKERQQEVSESLNVKLAVCCCWCEIGKSRKGSSKEANRREKLTGQPRNRWSLATLLPDVDRTIEVCVAANSVEAAIFPVFPVIHAPIEVVISLLTNEHDLLCLLLPHHLVILQ